MRREYPPLGRGSSSLALCASTVTLHCSVQQHEINSTSTCTNSFTPEYTRYGYNTTRCKINIRFLCFALDSTSGIIHAGRSKSMSVRAQGWPGEHACASGSPRLANSPRYACGKGRRCRLGFKIGGLVQNQGKMSERNYYYRSTVGGGALTALACCLLSRPRLHLLCIKTLRSSTIAE